MSDVMDIELTEPDSIRNCLVTGAASGIGRAVVHRLANDGWRVFASDIDTPANRALAEGLTASGNHVVAIDLDVSDPDQVHDAIIGLAAEVRIDALVNSVGVAFTQPITTTTARMLRSILAVNVEGTYYVLQAVARHMIRRRRGAIVNITSTAGFRPSVLPMTALFQARPWN